MTRTMSTLARTIIPVIAFTLPAVPALAEDDPQGWSDTAEFSYVMTMGNSEAQTLGFKNTATRSWERSSFVLKAGGIRAESTTETWFAVGTEDDFSYGSRSLTDKTAENYYLNGRFERKIHDRFFWYAGAGWERNRFAGIDNRYVAQGGVGNIWYDREEMKFKTDYAVTYTDQEDVVEAEGVDNSFVGARFSWEYLNKFGQNTTYENSFIVDLNLEETSRYRWNMINSLAVSMSARLALKVSLQWMYEADPAYQLVPLYDLLPPDPLPPAAVLVPRQLDELDTVFTTSLVVNF